MSRKGGQPFSARRFQRNPPNTRRTGFNVNVSSGIIKTLRIIPLMKLNGTLIQAAAKASWYQNILDYQKLCSTEQEQFEIYKQAAEMLKKPITSIDTVPAKDARINRQNVERFFFFNPAKIAVNGSK